MCETSQFFVRGQWNDAIDEPVGLLDSEPIVTDEVIPTKVIEVVLVDVAPVKCFVTSLRSAGPLH